MAFADLTIELEELISKSEFENKQLVRAINQENQLAASIDHELEIKRSEIESLQTEMGHMDQEMQHHDKQFKRNKENIENLKRTSDVLTEHVHAIQTQFEDMKLKRHEEKSAHDQQLQHFREVWMKYKETYEKYPRAVQLKKIKNQIQANEEFLEQQALETQKMKKAIEDIEKANYWKKMDWKTFCIELAENRLHVSRLREEIAKKKEQVKALNAQPNNEVEMQTNSSSNEKNIQKTPKNDTNRTDDDSNMDTCSPMISVFSERDDEEIEVMQTDQSDERGEDVSKTNHLQHQLQMSGQQIQGGSQQYPPNQPQLYKQNHAKENFMGIPQQTKAVAHQNQQNHNNVDQTYDMEMLNQRRGTLLQSHQQNEASGDSQCIKESSQQTYMSHNTSQSFKGNQKNVNSGHSIKAPQLDISSHLPFALYKKTGQLDGSFQEEVDLHLNENNNNQSNRHGTLPSQPSTNQSSSQSMVYKPQKVYTSSASSKQSMIETGFMNINLQNCQNAQSQLNRIPFRSAQVSNVMNPQSKALSNQISGPSLSYTQGYGRGGNIQQSTTLKPRQSSSVLLQAPQLTKPSPKLKQLSIPSVQMPKVSLNSVASPRLPSMSNRSPLIKAPHVPKVGVSRPDQQQTRQISDQHQMRQVSDQHQMRQVSDQHQMRQVSDQHQMRQGSDHHQMRQVSDQHQMRQVSNQQKLGPFSSASQYQLQFRRPQVIQTNVSVPENTFSKDIRPEKLKVQTSKVVQSFVPQPSPLPGKQSEVQSEEQAVCPKQPELNMASSPSPVKQSGMSNCKQPTNQIQHEEETAGENQNTNEAAPEKTAESSSSGQNILPPGNVYYVPLKGSPQKSTDQTRKRPIQTRSPNRQAFGSTALSPFNYEKHRQRLAELKKSPGFDQYAASRRMFDAAGSPMTEQGMLAGRGDNSGPGQSPNKQPVYTSVFGGAKKPAGDKNCTASPSTDTGRNFNLFSFGDSPGACSSQSNFTMFGDDNYGNKETPSDGFRLNFGGKDNTDSPGVSFSLFDHLAMDTSPVSFSFNFKGGDREDSPARGNVLSIFGERNDKETPSASGDFSFNFGREDTGKSPERGNVLSLFGEPSVEDTPTASGDFNFNFRKGDAYETPDRGNVLSLFGE